MVTQHLNEVKNSYSALKNSIIGEVTNEILIVKRFYVNLITQLINLLGI